MICCAMGVNEKEKAQCVAYQLKDVAQVLDTTWTGDRAPGEDPINWDILKNALLERFFPNEQREAKVEKFIHLRQEGM